MESEGVSLPVIHEHVLMPWNNNPREGDCCGRSGDINDGFYCNTCDFFVHKSCVEDCSESIEHSSHSNHTLQLRSKADNFCDLCGRVIKNLCYRCDLCDFDMDLYCAKYPPPELLDISKTHHHKLTLAKTENIFQFKCAENCGKDYDGFPYKCHECDLLFHMDCVWDPLVTTYEGHHPAELNHSCHSLHPLKLLIGQPPHYSDGKCRLCDGKVDHPFFYHCSPCNFTLDIRCALISPPQRSRLDLKTHDHQLTLLARLDSFTCTACGLKGDRSPYVCLQCDFIIHQRCLGLPRLININRHDHRVSRTSLLGIGLDLGSTSKNSVCGVCHKKVDWIWGGYSCQKCDDYVVHSKCATRKDVWNEKELEGVPEETENIDPYVVIDGNTIQHFSHEEHYLSFHNNGDQYVDNKRCNACNHAISFQSSYDCMDCDFILHQNCAEFPRKKWHMLHNDRLTLTTSDTQMFRCAACNRVSNGFRYKQEGKTFDVLCCSISEPFVHPSHPNHPLYHTLVNEEAKRCNGCGDHITNDDSIVGSNSVLSCIEDDCRFDICYNCATLPQVVKHRVDDYPLLLCYGEKADGRLWCDICEKETNPEMWFYTCKDHLLSLHTRCVLGSYSGLMPKSTIKDDLISYEALSRLMPIKDDLISYEALSGLMPIKDDLEVVLNNSMSRPSCSKCKLRCIFPIIFKRPRTSEYFCSFNCITFG